MKRLRLSLTGVAEILTEEAESKLEASEDGVLAPTCDNGRTLEDYENLGFPQNKIPKELIERTKEFEQGVELNDDDYEEIESDVVIYEEEIVMMVENVLEGTTSIFLKNGLNIRVAESPFEIDSYIDYLRMSWFEKKFNLFLSFFRRKFGRKK